MVTDEHCSSIVDVLARDNGAVYSDLARRGVLLRSGLENLLRSRGHEVVTSGVGAVFQEDTSFPWLTVWDNVAFGLRRHGVEATEITRRVEHALGVRDLESPRQGEGDYRFLCTADVEGFRTLGTRFLQMPLEEVEHIDLPARVPA